MKNTPSRVDVWLDGAYRGGKAWSDSTAFNLSVPLYIGKMNGGGWVDWSGMCIYDFKIYDDDHDIMHLIPVIDQNDVVCFYDEVSQSFFYNAGTGSLVAGAVY